MNYLFAVFPDRIKAEEAYTALEKAEIPPQQISILGRGYKSADEFGLIDPAVQGRKQALFMAFWLVPFGFIAGFTFNLLTEFNLFPWAGALGNHLIGGLFGAIGGGMGSFFVGGGIGAASSSGDALPYRNRLNAGKYIVVVRGSEQLKNQATPILRQFEPESLQGYAET
ncbi:hypothetical protein K4A83_04220 [Spirulina subsalsa FACHB-351]|uniref:Uncharacterized protein n=1 Tax=Spirulina subsalsa FACHB-351 TaxID=234711 RepID=A0ABT3L1V5_9CYAN|nr:hypothetical protein [Spirulina subsalsa]MCW6035482.1 hypothetical protein [Spirulina subsalsa FACHB-351]